MEILHQGLEIATQTGDRWVEGFLLGSLAEVHYHRKEYEQALNYGLCSLDLARRNGTPTLVNGAWLAVSWTYFELDQLERAQACLGEIEQTVEASGDRRGWPRRNAPSASRPTGAAFQPRRCRPSNRR